jgi:uncharacterized membrane protein
MYKDLEVALLEILVAVVAVVAAVSGAEMRIILTQQAVALAVADKSLFL